MGTYSADLAALDADLADLAFWARPPEERMTAFARLREQGRPVVIKAGERMRRVSMTPPRWLACAVIAAGLADVALALAHASSPLRAPLVMLFLVTAPAIAVAGLLQGLDTFARVFVACVAMVVINVLVAETMLAAGVWSPDRGLIVVVAITALAGVVQLPPVRRMASGHAPKWRATIRRVERL